MKKAPEAFRTISEVSDILDTPAHVLRFWESKFYQIRPVKRAGGRRYYRPDDMALLAGIRMLLQDQGMTIRGVQKILQEQGVRHVASLAPDPSVEAGFEDGTYSETVEPGVLQDDELNSGGPASVADPFTPPPVRPEVARPSAPLPLPAQAEETDEDEAADDTAFDIPEAADQHPGSEPRWSAASEAEASETDDTPAPGSSVSDAPDSDLPDSDLSQPDLSQSDQPSSNLPTADQSTADLPNPEPVITTRLPVPPAPDLSDHALNLAADAADRPARLLRDLRRDALIARHDEAAMLARRMNALLDRMSDASGAGRW